MEWTHSHPAFQWRGAARCTSIRRWRAFVSNRITHWLSNPNAVSYSNVDQAYLPGTNTTRTTQNLTASGNNVAAHAD